MWPSFEKLSQSTPAVLQTQSAKMTLVAVAASVTTAVAMITYQDSQRQNRVRQLKKELGRPSSKHMNQFSGLESMENSTITFGSGSSASNNHQKNNHDNHTTATTAANINIGSGPTHADLSPSAVAFDEELIRELLARNIAFLGEEGVDKLRKSFVIIVGAGGVGSWAASMLIRSGVGKIRIIDFDQVSLSSLNRHATANLADVGTPKVIAMKKSFRNVAPWVEVDARIELFQGDNAEELLSGNPDYVVDAIDNIHTKIALLKYCTDHDIPVMSSMGAGAKADPSRVQISDISETFEDPLARAVRRRLKKLGVEDGIDVVYSTEKPHHVKLLPLDETQALEADEYAALPDFRARILPVLGPLPAMFGMSMATFITCKIAGWPMEPLAVKQREGLYMRVHRDLFTRERKLDPQVETIALSRRDVGYVLDEMYRSKSILSQSQDKVGLCRWKIGEPLTIQNTVALTKAEIDKHSALSSNVDLVEVYGQEFVDRVEARFREEAQISRMR